MDQEDAGQPDLARFIEAQEGVWERALHELQAGQKRSHWMWFVFPQLAGLGMSPTAQFYGISGLPEAKAYLAHPVLGPRLLACTQAVLGVQGRSLHDIFGSPDDLKFRSSMTLFDQAVEEGEASFRAALERFCAGQPDPRTLELLRR
jgi:uncharacterized protein (DUF1810 family)